MKPYPRHEDFVAPARPTAQIWRLLAGIVLILILYGVLLRLYLDAVLITSGEVSADDLASGVRPQAAALLLASFITLALAVVLTALVLHRRGLQSLIGPPGQVLRDGLRVLVPTLALGALLLPLSLAAEDVAPGLPLDRWLLWLPAALPLLLIQVTAEELAFRGYLQQQLAARFANPLVFLLVPSVLFAAGHYLPEEFGSNALPVVLWSGLFGILAADLTARTGSLGAAIGFHLANNIFAILILSLAGDLDGLSLWRLELDLTDSARMQPLLLIDLALMLVNWLLARVMLRV